ncbi:uncharacterized protein LOC106641973 [Copidosoma floridanum]|uniref:uncharacterized protein LOC106641973 n=1 Tax=Copidosoma floridanum TaxID=29053 RepID=UPI0006C963F0|nr:uncharacterized protein LOC106641973 [Copidosoma floridanum]XP_014212076.1 uncharacterized protein LOC106641973 [Copidosoma floridanum]
MPGHRQPSSLEALSLGRVCQVLDGTCRRLQAWSLETSVASVIVYAKQSVRPYFANALTARLRSQVIEETTRMLFGPSTDGSTLIAGPAPLYLLALLLGHDIKRLKVNMCCYYGCSHQTAILRLLASEGSGLESLELARSALLGLDIKLLGSALLSMKNLQKLTLRNIANDAVLQIVGMNCPRLVLLDVACSRQVTDAGLKQLLLYAEFRDRAQLSQPTTTTTTTESLSPASSSSTSRWSRSFKSLWSKLRFRAPGTGGQGGTVKHADRQQVLLYHCESKNPLCNTLRVLNVANTGVTSAGVLLALMHVPRLESLAEYSHMGRVVEIMKRGVIDFKRPFSLTQVRSCRTTPGRLELLAHACPRVERLHISEPHHPPEALRLFPHVASLSVHGIPVQKQWLEGFYGYLRTHGPNLRELDLRVAQSDAPLDIDLREIFASCPNLRAFTKDGSNVVWSPGPDPPALKCLRRVQVGRKVTALGITKILSLAPELKALHVHSCFDLTNEQLERLLSEQPRAAVHHRSSKRGAGGPEGGNSLVRNLECFYIYEASKISAATVLSMFKSCGGLRRIGNLANWGLDCEGVKTLRGTLAKANLDVDLCPGSHWFWSDCIQ